MDPPKKNSPPFIRLILNGLLMNIVEVAILMPGTMGNQLWQKNHILSLIHSEMDFHCFFGQNKI